MTGENSICFLNIVPSVTVFGQEVIVWGRVKSWAQPLRFSEETLNAAACRGHLDHLMLSALWQTFGGPFQFQYNCTSAKSKVRRDLDDGNWWKRT